MVVDTHYFDISILPDTQYEHQLRADHNLFAYVIESSGYFDIERKTLISKNQLVLFDKGERIKISTKNEPVAWRGPIVMNTQKELDIAFQEIRDGSFIKN